MPVLLFILITAICSFAAEVKAESSANVAAEVAKDSSAQDVAPSAGSGTLDSTDSAAQQKKNIPLPRQTAYTGKGLSIGIGAGLYNPTEECDCVGIWQAQLEYFYSPVVSAGIDVRFLGGDLDSDVMLMYQRYRVNLRFHKVWDKLDLYVEPILGLENTSIEEFREQVKNHNSEIRDEGWHWSNVFAMVDSVEEKKSVEDCEKMFSLDGFSLGVAGGVGYVLTDYMGVTGSVSLEYNFSRAIQLTLSPGVALDLQRIWPWARKKLLSTWLSAEFGVQRYFNRGVDDWASYGFLGFQLAI